MYMNESEICTRYRQAKDKSEQIAILSQINLCTEGHIRNILRRGGILPAQNCAGKYVRRINWDAEIKPILRLLDEGYTYKQIAEQYGVSTPAIFQGVKKYKEEQKRESI